MAIYHFSVKTISRSNGRSAVACAAYRSGEKLQDDKYGKEQDYTKKSGVEFTEIYAPDNTNTELLNRQKLWNEVEKSERRKDALLAREFEIAFPSELNAEQRKNMLNELCQDLVKKYGVIVDAAIHAPHTDSGSDERNYHAHIMFTTRSINENGDFSAKKYRDFSRDNGTETVRHWRESFANLVNSELEKINSKERVSHLSYKDQDNGLTPTQHEGSAVTALRRQYEREQAKPFDERNHKIKMPTLAQENDAIKLQNLELEIIATEKLIQTFKTQNITFDDIENKFKTQKQKSFEDFFEKNHKNDSEKKLFAKLDDAISDIELKQKKLSAFDDFDILIVQAERKAEAERQAKIEAERRAEAERQRRQEFANPFDF